MKNKSDEEIRSLIDIHEKVLKIKKDLEKISNGLHNLDYTGKDNLIVGILKLSKELNEVILEYECLLDKNKCRGN